MAGCEESLIPDNEAPVITLIGEEDIYMFIDSEFSDPGVNVSDDIDLDITLVVSGLDFDTSLVNTYYIYPAESELMFPYSRYNQDLYQYFIEFFAYYYFTDLSNQELLDNAPQTYAFIEALIANSIEVYQED